MHFDEIRPRSAGTGGMRPLIEVRLRFWRAVGKLAEIIARIAWRREYAIAEQVYWS